MKSKTNKHVVDYCLEHYINLGHCSLCGNNGIIHTEGVRTPAGLIVGRANYCICPNGQKLRELNVDIEKYESVQNDFYSAYNMVELKR